MSEVLGEDIAARIGYIGPLLSPAEAASLGERERADLYDRVKRERLLLPVDRLLAIVATVSSLVDVNAAALVDALADDGDARAGSDAIRGAAEPLRALLAERARFARESRTLLRAAHRPPEADKLLRPVCGTPNPDTCRLVRASSRFDDEPVLAAPAEEP